MEYEIWGKNLEREKCVRSWCVGGIYTQGKNGLLPYFRPTELGPPNENFNEGV